MKNMVTKIMNCYGCEVTLVSQREKINFKAFLQPTTSRKEHYAKLQPGITGLEARELYVYIGPADREIHQGDEIHMKGHMYIVRSAEPVYDRDQIVYFWGLCVEKGRDGPWVQR